MTYYKFKGAKSEGFMTSCKFTGINVKFLFSMTGIFRHNCQMLFNSQTVAKETEPFTLAATLDLTASGEHSLLFPTQPKTQI